MRKVTFPRKKSVFEKLLLAITIVFALNSQAQTTLLTVGPSGAITVKSEGTLNVSGLELKPSADYTLNETVVTKELTQEVLNGSPSMEKIYSFDAEIENFLGTIYFNYEESEMNGLTHDSSLFVYDATAMQWSEYSDIDNTDFVVSATFTSPLRVNQVAVGSPNSLSVEDVTATGIKIYPNPSASIINVDYSGDLELTLINSLGQQVLKTNSKLINISALNKGVYILSAKDINNKINNFKIIKR